LHDKESIGGGENKRSYLISLKAANVARYRDSWIFLPLQSNFMRYFFTLLLFAFVYLRPGYSQPSEGAIAKAPFANFPESWSGDWNGTLEIFNAKGKVQSVEMTVEIHKIDTSKEGRYTFGLVYGSKEQDWRPYELVPVAPEKGIWKVDEKNSIAMESYLYGPKLICWFVVQGSRVLCTYEKTGDDTMVFEVISGMETAVSTTGNTKQAEEEIPEVKTYPCSVFQRAVLHKK
jgi:hypothetical protein